MPTSFNFQQTKKIGVQNNLVRGGTTTGTNGEDRGKEHTVPENIHDRQYCTAEPPNRSVKGQEEEMRAHTENNNTASAATEG